VTRKQRELVRQAVDARTRLLLADSYPRIGCRGCGRPLHDGGITAGCRTCRERARGLRRRGSAVRLGL
jgi:hypothetical protein